MILGGEPMIRVVQLCVLLFLVGCAHTQQLAPSITTVRVYFEPPQFAYQEIGTIAEEDEDYDDLIENLQSRALEMGGNAVLVTSRATGKESGLLGVNGILGAEEHSKHAVVAVVIRIPK